MSQIYSMYALTMCLQLSLRNKSLLSLLSISGSCKFAAVTVVESYSDLENNSPSPFHSRV